MGERYLERIVASGIKIGTIQTLKALGLLPEVVTISQAEKIYGRRLITEWRSKEWIKFYPAKNKERGKYYVKMSELETASAMMDIHNKDIKVFYGKIVDKRCILTINNLKPGNYSFKYFHDKNNNNKIDTNFIGIPKEGFGFANNAMNKFGPPDFKKTVFEVKQDTTLVCKACYMKF